VANVAQVRRLNYNGEDIGMGFNSDTGLAVGTALKFTTPTGIVSQEVSADVTIVTSHTDLMSSLHMSAGLEGRYAFASGSLKTDFAQKTQYNSSSTFVVAKMVVNNVVTRGQNFTLNPDQQHLLDSQIDVFNRAFGDSFVRGHYTGGEFYAVMRITSVDSKTESNLAFSLHASVQGGIAGVDFKGDFDKANTQADTKSEFSVTFYQKGGVGADEIGTTLDIDDIKKRLKDFPNAVRDHAFPYFIEVATYDTIPLPLPTKEQQEDFLIAIADADEKKLKYLQGHNDCDFASEHPDYFFDPPARPVLLTMSETYLQLANGAIDHAVRLSKGEIVPPRLFDPAKLTPPVSEPEIVLRKRDVGLERSFSDWWTTKDKPVTRKTDRMLVQDIGLAAIEELNDFNNIVDPGGDLEKTARLQGDALSRIVASFKEYDWARAGARISPLGPLDSLSALATMIPQSVKSLAFADNAITDTTGLDLFKSLVSLDLSHNALHSISELGSLTALRTLLLVDNKLSDLSPLQTCTSLETLDISGNNITDLTPLGSCNALKSLTISGTMRSKNGVPSRAGNPIVNARPIGTVPGLMNPFTTANTIEVRIGVLPDGDAAQFRGTGTRIGDSNAFRVHLTRGNEVLDDVWTLRRIASVQPTDGADFSVLFAGVGPSDSPLTGISLNIVRASVSGPFDLNISYVDPNDPKKAGIDLQAYPAFGTKIRMPTFDAVVLS
jgi:hypothetical protein